MGISFEVYNKEGEHLYGYSCKWLRDDAPRSLFWESSTVGKEYMTTQDISYYLDEFIAYKNSLEFEATLSEDDDNYDKWINYKKNEWMDTSTYEWMVGFMKILNECIVKGYTARWST
jgi:hypothetical protein